MPDRNDGYSAHGAIIIDPVSNRLPLDPSSFPGKARRRTGSNSRKHEADEQDAGSHHRISNFPAWRCRCRSVRRDRRFPMPNRLEYFPDGRPSWRAIRQPSRRVSVNPDFGFRTIFPIWSIEVPGVPVPEDHHLFSQKLKIGKSGPSAHSSSAVAAPPARSRGFLT